MARRLVAWFCLAALLASPLALADDPKGERRDGRKLQLEVDDLKATIRLDRELAGLEDAVKIEFDAEKGRVSVKHEEKSGGDESEQKLEARLLALVEFVDANGNGAYDPEETIASAWGLGKAAKDARIRTNGTVAWRDLEVRDVSSGDLAGKKLSGRASFGPNATFGLDFYVYGNLTFVGDAPLAPTEAKIDVVVQHYPYARADSALAVIVDLYAKEEVEADAGDARTEGMYSEMSAGALDFRLTFTWLENATVDGVDRAVRSTVLKNQEKIEEDGIAQKARVALSYARGDLIVHDPTIGARYEAASADARAVPVPAVSLAVAVALAAFARRRA